MEVTWPPPLKMYVRGGSRAGLKKQGRSCDPHFPPIIPVTYILRGGGRGREVGRSRGKGSRGRKWELCDPPGGCRLEMDVGQETWVEEVGIGHTCLASNLSLPLHLLPRPPPARM